MVQDGETREGNPPSVTQMLTNGLFQADEMMIRSFGEKLWIFRVKRSDGRVFETLLKGYSILEFKSALKKASEELGPIIGLDTDKHSSYPEATRQLGEKRVLFLLRGFFGNTFNMGKIFSDRQQ